jgi:hypothetical protein
MTLAFVAVYAVSAQEKPTPDEKAESVLLLDQALAHMQRMELREADSDRAVELVGRSLLNYGDSARANQNGTVWAFGKEGRPAAILELYQGTQAMAPWIHAVSLTGDHLIVMRTQTGTDWRPEKTQIKPVPFDKAPAPEDRETRRLRQVKELARCFSAHEYWDPDNSRFELRLLEQPVLRYQNAKEGIHDGAVFLLAHGTNPEVILLIEALGEKFDAARWHYSLARLGSAELHVEIDGREVWKQDRTPGIAGRPIDPYWIFSSPSEAAATPTPEPKK